MTTMVKWCGRRMLVVVILFVITMLIMYQVSLSGRHGNSTSNTDEAVSWQNEEDIDDIEVILHVAERIWSRNKPVLITVVNDAYLPFANSWLCNTVYMGIHEQVLIIATDSVSRDDLARQWPHVHVVALSGEHELSGDQKFGHAGYVRIMIRRTEIILHLLKQNMEVLLFEVDCVWLTNPIPECQKQVLGYDMAATGVTNRPDIIAGGFLYLKPTDPLLTMWEKLTEMLMSLKTEMEFVNVTEEVSESANDQTYLSRLVANGYGDVAVNVMSLDKFADGRWYKKDREERKHLRPLIINNNWISKNKGKMRRARKFHHWFWKNSAKCDLNLVKATVY